MEWKREQSKDLPLGKGGMHRGWTGIGTDQDSGQYAANGWQDKWQSGDRGGKQIPDDDLDKSDKRKWSYGSGGNRGWGIYGSDNGKPGTSTNYGADSGFADGEPKNSYTSWGNTKVDSWQNIGGGEGWRKWEGSNPVLEINLPIFSLLI